MVLARYGENILAFEADAAQVWGRLRVQNPGHELDKQIAAIALVNDLTVVTRNSTLNATRAGKVVAVVLHLPRETAIAHQRKLHSSPAQKSGLSAVGTAAALPAIANSCVLSAHTTSRHSSIPRRYVMVADHGIVKTPSSSTVNWSCRCLPL